MTKADEILKAFEEAGTGEWEALYDRLRATDVRDHFGKAEKYADSMAQFYSGLQEYLSCREMGTGHEHAMKEAAKTRKKVRKALGYSYP